MRDLPHPEWWAHAQRCHANGMFIAEIARNLGRPIASIRYAVFPEYRERQKQSNLRYRKVLDEAGKKRKADAIRQDYKRLSTRRIARERWRESGRKRSLTAIYRELDCL